MNLSPEGPPFWTCWCTHMRSLFISFILITRPAHHFAFEYKLVSSSLVCNCIFTLNIHFGLEIWKMIRVMFCSSQCIAPSPIHRAYRLSQHKAPVALAHIQRPLRSVWWGSTCMQVGFSLTCIWILGPYFMSLMRIVSVIKILSICTIDFTVIRK